MRKSLLLIGLFLLVACAEQEARRPIYRSNDKGMGQSIDRNKKINAQQQERFKKTIEKDSALTYYSSPVGYWYAYKNKTESTAKPTRGDMVKFNYTIQTLEGSIIYAVKDLSVGDIGVFLMPSYLSYGYQGDGDKVGINQPLKFTIQLTDLKKASNPKDSK